MNAKLGGTLPALALTSALFPTNARGDVSNAEVSRLFRQALPDVSQLAKCKVQNIRRVLLNL